MPNEKIQSFRDLTLVFEEGDGVLVIACDSLGGIGPKPYDCVKVPAEVVGKYAGRTPLMEVLASGATPFLLVNNICTEMEPTGEGIIRGIKEELRKAGLSLTTVITGSTEKNVTTCQTALGITVFGRTVKKELKLGKAQKGDLVICIGQPRVGKEVIEREEKNADPALIKKLLDTPYVREILPVGSQGILYEGELLARCSGNTFVPDLSAGVDLKKSAGPATCVLVSVVAEEWKSLQELTSLPLFPVGKLC